MAAKLPERPEFYLSYCCGGKAHFATYVFNGMSFLSVKLVVVSENSLFAIFKFIHHAEYGLPGNFF